MVVGDGKLNIGELTKFDWKVSMGMSSSGCKNLDASTVTLKLFFKNSSGEDYTESLEMSLQEFQVSKMIIGFKIMPGHCYCVLLVLPTWYIIVYFMYI